MSWCIRTVFEHWTTSSCVKLISVISKKSEIICFSTIREVAPTTLLTAWKYCYCVFVIFRTTPTGQIIISQHIYFDFWNFVLHEAIHNGPGNVKTRKCREVTIENTYFYSTQSRRILKLLWQSNQNDDLYNRQEQETQTIIYFIHRCKNKWKKAYLVPFLHEIMTPIKISARQILSISSTTTNIMPIQGVLWHIRGLFTI